MLRPLWRDGRQQRDTRVGEEDGHKPDLPEDLRATCRMQADAAIWSLICCSSLFQLDPPEALLSVFHMPRVVAMAHALGRPVPRTLVTNDPVALRRSAATRPSVVNLNDDDGDGLPEEGVPAGEELLLFDHEGLELWRVPNDDISGVAGCSGFDRGGCEVE